MKLWHKLFVSMLTLLVLVCSGLSLLFLHSEQTELWARERQRAATQQQYLASLVKTGVVSQRLQLGALCLSAAQTDDAASLLLERQATDDYILVSGLYRTERFLARDDAGLLAASELLNLPNAENTLTYSRVFRHGAQLLLALNAPINLEQQQYRLVSVFDVTGLELHLRGQVERAVLFSLFASVMAAGALLLLVLLLLRPLGQLSRTSRSIAAGNYSQRVDAVGKDELAQLGQDMNRMAQTVESRITQLEQVAQDQKAFIANMAHEMKTPLTSILGFADLLRIQKNVSDDKRAEYASIIVEETSRLRSLSGKLMELLNLGSQNLVFTTEPLDEVMGEVAAAMQPVLHTAELTLTVHCPAGLWLQMDRELFKSLLYNLLDNARKASPTGREIRLAAAVEEGRVLVVIRDWGQGIPRKELAKVCQPFYMVDKSRSRKAGGAGLGLALCQEIVRIHGGEFSIDSRVGQGTLITLRFVPAARPEKDIL